MMLDRLSPELDAAIRAAAPHAWRSAAAVAAMHAVRAADLEGDYIGQVARDLRADGDPDPTQGYVVAALADELRGFALDHPGDQEARVRAEAASAVAAAAGDHPGQAALAACAHACLALEAAAREAMTAEVLATLAAAAEAPLPGTLTAAQARAAAEVFASSLGAALPAEPDATAAWERAVRSGLRDKPGD